MAFHSPHWKDDVNLILSTFTEKATILAEEYNNPFSIKAFTKLWLLEYEEFLKRNGPVEVPEFVRFNRS